VTGHRENPVQILLRSIERNNKMKNSIIRWLTPAALALLLVASGCELTPTSVDTTADEAAILSLLGEESDLFDADLFTAEGTNEPGSAAKIATAIVPWRFGRQISTKQKDISISIDETVQPATAEVSWTVIKTGVFLVMDTTHTIYSKDFSDTMIKFATLERRGNMNTDRRGWRIISLSGTEIISDDATVGINSINLTSTGGVDTTFNNVSTLVLKGAIKAFAPQDTITVTVTTNNLDDVVLLHYPAWRTDHQQRHHRRVELVNNGDGTHTGTWVTRGMIWRHGQMRNPPRYITIDVLSHGTIYDDELPYDSIAWGFVYRIGN